jgi:predicted unusual protein kinase regulating ubiquinone biosynthesis (AarF/ABC1/UbiB family)
VTLYIVLGAVGALLLLSVALPTPRRVWLFNIYAWKYVWLWLFGVVGLARRRGRPALIRLFCEDMGPTFIKFGQIVASSSGMFPKRYVTEFQKCLDRVRPFAFDDVRRILDEELGAKAARLTEVEPRPLASASIAQVHTAKLDGKVEVVLKVQRPGIAGRIEADMKIMKILAAIVARLVKDAELANPVAIVEDFRETLREELDFRKEADNLERFNEIMAELGHADVRAPRPEDDLTTRRVLVMERFYGVRVDDVEMLKQRSERDAEDKLIKGMRAWFQSVLFYGFFHGDVHAGNLMLLDNDDIGFLDFGIVGRFNARQREMVTEYIVSFASGDYKSLAKTLVEMGGVSAKVDQGALAGDLEVAYRPLLSKTFQEINYAEVLPQIQRVASKHKMRLLKEFVLITKQMLYFDRYAKLIAPNLNLFTDPRLVMSLMADVTKARALVAAALATAPTTAAAGGGG